ncbi:hypothetical protein HPP92_000744 [Vanilla planifolia]|uniref:Thiamine pyrophosphate enzyme N-terminal TPP-binding domain-containing protein n=1 Tax=Vanilla planifolia TaxID=51239 RepID=A0A835SBR9_VANPL|nr:hypothetical protein HPP92_000744 [Vanilla planifolia]
MHDVSVHPSLKLLSKDDTIPICKIWATKPAKPVANIDHVSIERAVSSSHSATKTTLPPLPPSPSRRFAADEPHKGADILVEALERESVTDVFAYAGGASMEIHQALTRSLSITNHLFRHEQGEIFAAEGYARSTGRPGVCIATSGPGATNLVSGARRRYA